MRIISKMSGGLPGSAAAALALLSSLILATSFPDTGYWFVGWVAFVPLLIAIEVELPSRSAPFLLSWLFGTVFFFLTCWWLTFAPITYAGFPVVPTYFLLFLVSATVGVFPAVFGLIHGFLRRRLGTSAFLVAPFVWIATEFLRYWITGNNWNALAYSQAFVPGLIQNASIGGIYLTGFTVFFASSLVVWTAVVFRRSKEGFRTGIRERIAAGALAVVTVLLTVLPLTKAGATEYRSAGYLVAVQPNVPMAGLDIDRWESLRERQMELAERGLAKRSDKSAPVLVVLPESPMNYQYGSDPEFQAFIDDFARRNSASVLFNSAEPDPARERGFFNSAVMIDPKGGKAAQYDKIHLLPFGEFVPLPEFAQDLIPPMVGRFSRGSEYDLLEVGGAEAGVMICFESHFASLSAEYARRGAGFLIEMTNDGYLGDTPVLRQHLANAVFRAVETGLPLMRVTNVGITAKIDERGNVLDEQPVYKEAVSTWRIELHDEGKTIYVQAGDWFAVLSCFVSAAFLFLALRSGRKAVGGLPETASSEELG